MPHHLIFEGPELAGKSWLMSQVYDFLEPKYNQNKNVLDGCHWFNCDVGVFGTPEGQKIVDGYLPIFETLLKKNIIVEKFHIADKIYNRLYNGPEIAFDQTEESLAGMGFKLVLVTFPDDVKKLEKRIEDRLNLYPHYERILKPVDWYFRQQEMYQEMIKKSRLPFLEVATDVLPDRGSVSRILEWIGEKDPE